MSIRSEDVLSSLNVLKRVAQAATTFTALAAGPTLALATAPPVADPALQATLDARYQGDISGACVMAAVIEGTDVRRARYCAQPQSAGLPDWNAAFEIGSITKTMAAFLVSDLIAKGKWSLDDPIAMHLPKGTKVPRQGERQILVRDLLTHSAGLPPAPSRMKAKNPEDPWADLTEQEVMDSLGDVTLNAPIGTTTAYSNFGMAVVSLAVSRAYGTDFETAIRGALFEPLGMHGAYITKPAPGTTPAQGHKAPGVATPAWHLGTNLAGIGMVRATLEDMVRYAQAQLNVLPTPLYGRLKATQAPIVREVGMSWFHMTVKGHNYVMHNGGTGGFRSALIMEPNKQRAVILLSNTSYADGGEVDATALTLINPDSPMPKARTAVATSADALKNLPGSYSVEGVEYKVWAERNQLWVSAANQAPHVMQMDSRGDFHALGAIVTPEQLNATVNRLAVVAGGEHVEGLRVGFKPQYRIQNPLWKDWAGEYQLMPGFTLKVFEESQRLYVQGTGQKPIEVEVSRSDQVQALSHEAVIDFVRNSQGQVDSLTLRQRGNVMNATILP